MTEELSEILETKEGEERLLAEYGDWSLLPPASEKNLLSVTAKTEALRYAMPKPMRYANTAAS